MSPERGIVYAHDEALTASTTIEAAPEHTDAPIAAALGRLEGYLAAAREDPEQSVLYEQQVPVMQDLYDAIAAQGTDLKGYISLPTGVGKTVLFTEFIRATGLRTLVLTPTQLLLKQTEHAFGKFGSDSDVTIGTVYANEKNGDEHVTITTYASFVQHTKDADSAYIQPDKYDVIILDEAHRALGEATTQALAAYPNTMLIGLTATENYSDRRKLDSLLPTQIHKMSIQEAVTSRLISPFSVWVAETDTDLSQVRISSTNEYDLQDLQRAINTQARNRVAIELYIANFAGKKVIFSCSGVKHAKAVADQLQASGVPAAAIHGQLTLAQQQYYKARFASTNPADQLLVLCNDKILAEGFDEPSIAAVFNLAPTLSSVRAQQRSGRALRLNPDDPDKHAVIVEFIDKNYRKPPVLFADPSVAATANHGAVPCYEATTQTYSFNMAAAHIITDPQAVARLVEQFAEARRDQRPRAPEDWLTISALREALNVPLSALHASMKQLKSFVPELLEEDSGKFLARGVRDGVTTYYSPRIKEGLAILLESPEVAPADWLTAGQVAARYGLQPQAAYRVLQEAANDYRFMRTVQGRSHGSYVERPGSARKKYFFHPEVVKATVEQRGLPYVGNAPPENWINQQALAAQFGPNASEAALKAIQATSEATLFNHSTRHEDTVYYSAKVVEKVSKLVTPQSDWKSVEDIAQKCHTTNEAVLQILHEVAAVAQFTPHVCFVNDREILYYPPLIAARIISLSRQAAEAALSTETDSTEATNPSQSNPTQPTEFTADVPVLIPHFEQSTMPQTSPEHSSDQLPAVSIRLPAKSRKPRAVNSAERNRRQPPTRDHTPAPVQHADDNTTHTPPANRQPNAPKSESDITFSYLHALKRFRRPV